jgi:hypothetical protein
VENSYETWHEDHAIGHDFIFVLFILYYGWNLMVFRLKCAWRTDQIDIGMPWVTPVWDLRSAVSSI